MDSHSSAARRVRLVRLLRISLLVGVVAILTGVVVSWLQRPTVEPPARVAQPAPEPPTGTPRALQQGERFTARQTRAGRPDYELEAERVVGQDDGAYLLEEVERLVIHADAGPMTLEARNGRYDGSSHDARLMDEVHVTEASGLEMDTELIHYVYQDRLLTSPKHVRFERGILNGSGLGLLYRLDERVLVLQQEPELELLSEAGDPPIRIRARRLVYELDGERASFYGDVLVTRADDWIRGESLTALLGGDARTVESLEMTGPLTGRLAAGPERGGGPIELAAGEMQVRFGTGTRYESIRLAREPVVIERSPAGAAVAELAATVVTLSFAPNGVSYERAQMEGDARLSRREAGGGYDLDAETLDLTFAADGRGYRRAVLTGEASVRTLAVGGQLGRTLTAGESLDVEFAPDGVTADRFAADGGVTLLSGPEDAPGRLDARRLNGRFTPDGGELREAEADGEVRYVGGDLTADAETMRMDADGRMELRGTDATPPRVRQGSDVIVAREIDLDRDGATLEARGEVKTEIAPGSADAAEVDLGLFDDRAPVLFRADTLSIDREREVALYRGSVAAVQGVQSLEADEVELRRGTDELLARGSCLTRYTPPEPVDGSGPAEVVAVRPEGEPSADERSLPVLARADALHYTGGARRLTYTGTAELIQGSSRVAAVEIEIDLDETGGPSVLRARREVRFAFGQRSGTGDYLEQRAEGEEVLLIGVDTLARVVDPEHGGTLSGRRLTFRSGGGSIQVEGGDSGRIWVELDDRPDSP